MSNSWIFNAMLIGEEKDYSVPPVFKKWIAEGKMTEEEAQRRIENAKLLDNISEEWKDEKDDKYFGVRE